MVIERIKNFYFAVPRQELEKPSCKIKFIVITWFLDS